MYVTTSVFLQDQLTAHVKSVENNEGSLSRREVLRKPFRVTVSRNQPRIIYPVKFLLVRIHI